MPIKRLYIFLILFFGLFFVFVGLNKAYAATGAVCGCPSQCGQTSCGSLLTPKNNNNCTATELCVATYGSSGGLCGSDYTGNCDTSTGTYGNPCKENHSGANISYSCNGSLYVCQSSSGCRCMNSSSECSGTSTLCTREGDNCCINPTNLSIKYCNNSALSCCLNGGSTNFEKCVDLSSNPSACNASGDFCGNEGQICCLVGSGKDTCVSGLFCVGNRCGRGENSANPPAPGYKGPIIEPSKLLGSVGAILYPLGIGIGLFFIIKAGYEFMTSEGEPQRVKAAQEDLTSAVVGLIFIVLSTVILNIIINSLIGG